MRHIIPKETLVLFLWWGAGGGGGGVEINDCFISRVDKTQLFDRHTEI